MADQSIFDGTKQEPPVTTTTPAPSDDLNDLLSQIKNEHGEPKYKSLKDALVGLQHSQEFIKTLRSEKSTVEEELKSIKPVAEKVTELERVVLELTKPTTTAPTSAPAVSEEAVAKLVEATLSRKQQEEVAKRNLGTVVEEVRKEFGDKAEEVFYQKAQEIGLSRAEINALAARTPQAALKLIGVVKKEDTKVTITHSSSINTTAIEPTKDSFIGRNTKRLDVGATASELQEESARAKKMVDELNSKGMSIDELTKPSNYFKFFK